MLNKILGSFGLAAENNIIQKLSTGLINHTWKITGESHAYILQQINSNVFKSPQDISENILKANSFLAEHAPDYLFVSPIASTTGQYLVQDTSGNFYRLTPFINGSHTIDTVTTKQQAFEAARQFGKFTRLLSAFNAAALHYTLPDFHNLALRFAQFESAHKTATAERLATAKKAIANAYAHQHLVQTYQSIIAENTIPLRVTHHDTKISNVLFDDNDNGLCVIDLDTMMPGYFISDLGDMLRTYLSPANEEEQNFDKVEVREDYFQAIIEGYFAEMAYVLTDAEKELLLYAGKFMIYMQAIRFLTDFLNGDIYYTTAYPKHNLVRAQNQFTLLHKYLDSEKNFSKVIQQLLKENVSEISYPPTAAFQDTRQPHQNK